jgi:hypothetical protein
MIDEIIFDTSECIILQQLWYNGHANLFFHMNVARSPNEIGVVFILGVKIVFLDSLVVWLIAVIKPLRQIRHRLYGKSGGQLYASRT